MRITVKHMRRAGLCAAQCRKQFLQKGLNWSAFLSEGIEEEDLIKHFGDNAIVMECLENLDGR
jgi:hypothetical protein